MLRNRQVSRVRAEPPWRHFLHSDNAALLSLPFTSSAWEQQKVVWTVSVPITLKQNGAAFVFSKNQTQKSGEDGFG